MTEDVWPERLPGLNLSETLKRIGLPVAVFKTILDKFVETNADKELAIQTAFADGKLDEVSRLVHGLKGAAGNIGADELYATACVLNVALKEDENKETVTLLVVDLLAQLQVLLHSISLLPEV